MTTPRRLAALLVLCLAAVTPAALNATPHDDRLRTLDQRIEELLFADGRMGFDTRAAVHAGLDV